MEKERQDLLRNYHNFEENMSENFNDTGGKSVLFNTKQTSHVMAYLFNFLLTANNIYILYLK